MKKIAMKDIARELVRKDKKFETHIGPMQLALFKDKKLSEIQEEKVFEHLSKCKRCREILKIASELEREEKEIAPINNPDYKGMLKRTMPFAASFIILVLGAPQVDKYLNDDVNLKGSFMEKSILEETIDYWEELFEKILKGE